jgi:hypothetical protein
LPEAVRNIGMQFDRHLSVASLRLDDNRQGDPFAACVGCRDSMLSYSPLCYSMISSA